MLCVECSTRRHVSWEKALPTTICNQHKSFIAHVRSHSHRTSLTFCFSHLPAKPMIRSTWLAANYISNSMAWCGHLFSLFTHLEGSMCAVWWESVTRSLSALLAIRQRRAVFFRNRETNYYLSTGAICSVYLCIFPVWLLILENWIKNNVYQDSAFYSL